MGFAGKFNAAMELYQVHRNSFVIQAASGICQDVDFLARVKGMFWKDITRFAYNNAELLIDSMLRTRSLCRWQSLAMQGIFLQIHTSMRVLICYAR